MRPLVSHLHGIWSRISYRTLGVFLYSATSDFFLLVNYFHRLSDGRYKKHIFDHTILYYSTLESMM